MRRVNSLEWIGLSSLALSAVLAMRVGSARAADAADVPVGVATVDVTPSYPIRMTGYGSRKTESEGVESRLFAKALAIGGDADGPCVLVAVDNCAVPGWIVEEVATRLKTAVKLPRERFVVSATHTHTGPALSKSIPTIFGGPLPADQQGRVDRYTRELTDAIEKAALQALGARSPGRLSWAEGTLAFAANRRVLKDGVWAGFGINPNGTADRRMPAIRVTDLDGKLRAVLIGYACHCTTLGGDFNKICGDWAGYACEAIEREHPGTTALVVLGCGGDANPEPRLKVDDAKRHGGTVAAEFARLLKGPWRPLPTPVAARFRRIEVPLTPTPPRAELERKAKQEGPEGYLARLLLERLDRGEALAEKVPYPVATWCFGDALAVVFLGGEVVSDYALRVYQGTDAARVWVAAYSNDVPCYISSRRILSEGGYEPDFSMIYYGHPGRLAPEVEDLIIGTVHDLLPASFDGERPR